jgi:hypothetical protein
MQINSPKEEVKEIDLSFEEEGLNPSPHPLPVNVIPT